MASATNIMVRSVNRPVVTQNRTALTTFDPILNDPGARPTLVRSSATPRSGQAWMRNGGVINATSALRVRTREEARVALPRRDYRKTVYPAGALLGPR